MGSQEELQDLLRLLTKNNGSVLTVMGQVKSLQLAKLRSIQEIADAPLDVMSQALGDTKGAKLIQAICKKSVRNGTRQLKRSGSELGTVSDSQVAHKRSRHIQDDAYALALSHTEAEHQDLELPVVLDLELLESTRVYTNRAPLLLAFAFELIRLTMPEQPVSSRLSLSQAVVSLNARTKAANLGMGGQDSSSHGSWGDGQPNVTVLGRKIPVLRRDGYAPLKNPSTDVLCDDSVSPSLVDVQDGGAQPHESPESAPLLSWTVSRPITSRGSTFVARIISVSDSADGSKLVRKLVDADEKLSKASHNSWGLRMRQPGTSGAVEVVQQSDDDGETGCGAFILDLLRDAQLNDVLVVVSRWFGGVLLGPQRWTLMRKCFDEAVSDRLRQTRQAGRDGSVALWALDVQDAQRYNRLSSAGPSRLRDEIVPGAAVFHPEAARDYLGRSFLSNPLETQTSRGAAGRRRGPPRQDDSSAQHNMACVLGAVRSLMDSWKGHLSAQEMDARAWMWYTSVRPQVSQGPGGWGEKGWLELKDILAMRYWQAK